MGASGENFPQQTNPLSLTLFDQVTKPPSSHILRLVSTCLKDFGEEITNAEGQTDYYIYIYIYTHYKS